MSLVVVFTSGLQFYVYLSSSESEVQPAREGLSELPWAVTNYLYVEKNERSWIFLMDHKLISKKYIIFTLWIIIYTNCSTTVHSKKLNKLTRNMNKHACACLITSFVGCFDRVVIKIFQWLLLPAIATMNIHTLQHLLGEMAMGLPRVPGCQFYITAICASVAMLQRLHSLM